MLKLISLVALSGYSAGPEVPREVTVAPLYPFS